MNEGSYLSHCSPVCVRVRASACRLTVFMRVFRQAATADPQAPAGPFSGGEGRAQQGRATGRGEASE